jgi:hypothetical protein
LKAAQNRNVSTSERDRAVGDLHEHFPSGQEPGAPLGKSGERRADGQRDEQEEGHDDHHRERDHPAPDQPQDGLGRLFGLDLYAPDAVERGLDLDEYPGRADDERTDADDRCHAGAALGGA